MRTRNPTNLCSNTIHHQVMAANIFSAGQLTCNTWNIVVCDGESEPVLMTIPSHHTVLQLKQQIQREMRILVGEQKALYCQEKPLPDEKHLSDCEGMRNGTAILVARKPFTIQVYRNDIDITKAVEAPSTDIQSWKIGKLHDYILTKVGVPLYVPHVLALGSMKITGNDQRMVIDNAAITSGCHLILTVLQEVECSDIGNSKFGNSSNTFKVVPGPQAVSPSFISSEVFYGKKVTNVCTTTLENWNPYTLLSTPEMGCLSLYVQNENGSKVPIQLPDHFRTSIISLREIVSKSSLKVPTHQQRLMLGETELKDWDEEGRPLLLYSYPSMQNGSTINLTIQYGGIHVKINCFGILNCPMLSPSQNGLPFVLKAIDDVRIPKYINIPDRWTFTLKQLGVILEATGSNGDGYGNQGPHLAVKIDMSPVSTVPWIDDGCTVIVQNGIIIKESRNYYY